MKSKRRICIYTSTRADYGLLRGVIRRIADESALQLQILASGMHLSPEFGMTVEEIRADGFVTDEAIEILMSSDTPTAVCKSMGVAMMAYGDALQRLNPDMVVLLGDRFETFCMAAASQVCRVPIAHIHGGETTEGVIDEAFRHSITKMSHLHFASCEAYRRRIIQLGESPDRVFNVGALGVENIRRVPLMKRSELADTVGFDLGKPYFLVTFHPVTLEKDDSERQFQNLLRALDSFPGINVILTKANADTEGRAINRSIDHYAAGHPMRCLAVTSLGMRRYLSALKYAAAAIGNSSSGIIEAPSFNIPTINIGDRQDGRIKAESIIDCEAESSLIELSIRKALSKEFRERLGAVKNPYEQVGTASRIVEEISLFCEAASMKKRFHDIGAIVQP